MDQARSVYVLPMVKKKTRPIREKKEGHDISKCYKGTRTLTSLEEGAIGVLELEEGAIGV